MSLKRTNSEAEKESKFSSVHPKEKHCQQNRDQKDDAEFCPKNDLLIQL
jgi:hypothetical protein